MNTIKECPKCGGKELRTEVTIKPVPKSTFSYSLGESILQDKLVSVTSYQCRECGEWFS